MRHTVIVARVDLDGILDGFAEVVLPETSPPTRLVCVVFAPSFGMDEQEISECYSVGKPSIRELWLMFASKWQPAPEGRRGLRQLKGGAGAIATGKVTEVVEKALFRLDCGLVISVELLGDLPKAGQWISVRGSMVCWPEGFSEPDGGLLGAFPTRPSCPD